MVDRPVQELTQDLVRNTPSTSIETAQQKLKKLVQAMNLNIPEQVFQFDLNREQTAPYQDSHPETPFILRKSSQKSFISLSYQDNSTASIRHVLLSPPNGQHQDFKICTLDAQGIEIPQVDSLFKSINELVQHRAQALENWQKFKKQLTQTHTAAVLSIQSLDNENPALEPSQIKKLKETRPGLTQIGGGHTGFAMALALNAPFAVLNDKGQREKANMLLKDHIKGLIVVTGHGLPNGNSISGSYSKDGSTINVERTPAELVQALMEAGLKQGDKPTILLSVCFSAVAEDSLAHKVAKELAKHGISSTIIASEKPVSRFAHNVLEKERVTFGQNVGMKPQEVCVFTTEVQEKENNPQISLYRPNETIQLSAAGLSFLTKEELALQKIRDAEIQKTQDKDLLIKLKTNPSLLKLFNSIQQMERYGMYLQTIKTTKGNTVIDLAHQLNDKLELFLINSIKKQPSPTQLLTFQKEFKHLAHSKDRILSDHREQWKPIVANILLAFTGVGFLLIIAKDRERNNFLFLCDY